MESIRSRTVPEGLTKSGVGETWEQILSASIGSRATRLTIQDLALRRSPFSSTRTSPLRSRSVASRTSSRTSTRILLFSWTTLAESSAKAVSTRLKESISIVVRSPRDHGVGIRRCRQWVVQLRLARSGADVQHACAVEERDADSGPQVVVRRRHHQQFRCRLREPNEIRHQHGVNQFLFVSPQHRTRRDVAIPGRTCVVFDEPGKIGDGTMRRARASVERRGRARKIRRNGTSPVRVRQVDSVAYECARQLHANQDGDRTVAVRYRHASRKCAVRLANDALRALRQRESVEPAAVETAAQPRVTGASPGADRVQESGHGVPKAVRPNAKVVVVDECDHVGVRLFISSYRRPVTRSTAAVGVGRGARNEAACWSCVRCAR